MTEGDLQRRIDQLETRLARIESRLDASERPPSHAADVATPAPEPADDLAAPARRSVADRTVETPPRADDALAAATETPPAPPTTPDVAPSPPRPIVEATPPPPAPGRPAPRTPQTPVELLIGSRWMAWAGAIGVVVAVGFFLKLAYDRGWWSLISPTMRCLAGAGFGMLLLAGGEVAFRRVGRAAAAGLSSAGIATLYLVAFAASAAFTPPVISEPVAFAAMGLVALVGFAITHRTRFMTIGLLSLIAGYATPLLLGWISGQGTVVPAYLTMLLAIALGLSMTRPREFRVLRDCALTGQLLVGGIWLLADGQLHWGIAIVSMSLWWAMVLAESTVAAIRRQSAIGNIVITMLATAAYVTGATWVLDAAAPPAGFSWTGIFVAAVGLIGVINAVQFGPGIEVLRAPARTAMGKLALLLWVQGGALLAIAIAMQFDGYGETIGWLAVGLAAIETARRLPSRGVGVFGLLVGGLAIARLVLIDSWMNAALQQSLLTVGPLDITGWTVLAVGGVAAMHAAARRLGEPARDDSRFTPWPVMAPLLAVGGTLLWVGACMVACRDEVWTSAGLLTAVALLAIHRLGRREGYLEIAFGVLTGTALWWLLIDGLRERASASWDPFATLPWLNPQMAMGIAIASAAAWTAVAFRRRAAGDPARVGWLTQTLIVAAAVVVLLAASFELERMIARFEATTVGVLWPAATLRALWWTALWAAGGLMIVVGARGSRSPLVQSAGWLVLCGSAVVWLIIDTLALRMGEPAVPCTPVLNLQFGVGAAVAAMLVIAVRALPKVAALPAEMQETIRSTRRVALGLVTAIGLWLGSLEIDRVFMDSPMMIQTGLSIYWGLYAVMLIVIGFARRIAVARYVGIGIFCLTVLKVMVIDMAQVEQIWRVLSCLAVGLLLIATSILYSKLAPRLLAGG